MKEQDKLIELLKGHNVYLQTHNFPDPDALASAYGMQQFLKLNGIETKIIYCGNVDKLSTKKMISEFGIDVVQYTDDFKMDISDYIVTIDGQKNNSNFTDLPGDEVACIDHHPIMKECEYKYSDIRIVGACSSIVAEYFKDAGIEMEENIASALMYGLKMDTASFSRGVSDLDIEMFGYLYKYADNDKVTKLYVNNMEMDDLKGFAAAIEDIEVEDDLGFAYVPYECNDGLIAMICDFILSVDEVSVCVVYAPRNGGYKLSIRSLEDGVHAGNLAAKALEGIGDGGGHAAMAGGVIFKDIDSKIKENIHEEIKNAFVKCYKK